MYESNECPICKSILRPLYQKNVIIKRRCNQCNIDYGSECVECRKLNLGCEVAKDIELKCLLFEKR